MRRAQPVETPELQDELSDKGVKYCIGAYVDIHGVPKARSCRIDHLDHMAHGLRALHRLRAGRPRPGSRTTTSSTSVPDLDHIIQLPWEPKIAWMPADNHFQGQALCA